MRLTAERSREIAEMYDANLAELNLVEMTIESAARRGNRSAVFKGKINPVVENILLSYGYIIEKEEFPGRPKYRERTTHNYKVKW